jgi:hypothetical protein
MQESRILVSVAIGGLLKRSTTSLVLPVLYLMLRWISCKYVDHF